MMQEPPHLDIESSFNEFVDEFGGELVSKLLPSSPPFDNADYLFRNDSVVAELKCLEKDILEEDDSKAKVNALYDGWLRKGLVGPAWETVEINTATLPIQCQWEVYSLIKKPIERTIKKANRQIRETKEHFKKAFGLLSCIVSNPPLATND